MKSLKTKIILLVDLCVIFTSVLVSTLSISSAVSIANTNSQITMALTCQNSASKINNLLACIEQSVNTLALISENSLDDLNAFQTNDAYVETYTKSLEPIALNFGNNTAGALSVYIRYNPEFTSPTSGVFLFKSNTDSEFESITPTDFSSYDPTDTTHVGWYYLPIEKKEACWLDAYQNANVNNTTMISYVVPIFKNDVAVGVVGMDINFEQIQNIVAETNIYSNGYAFLTNSENLIMYHPALSLNDNLNTIEGASAEMVNALNANTSSNDLIDYTFNGEQKDMTFTTLDNNMKFVLTASNSEIYQNSKSLALRIILICIFTIILTSIISFILANAFSAPLIELTNIIENTSNFNFIPSKSGRKLRNLKDEIGNISRAIHHMRQQLRSMVQNIDTTYNTISENLLTLNDVTNTVNTMCMDNSATTEQLSAGMQETAATTSDIAKNIVHVKEGSKTISKLSLEGNELSKEVFDRANNLKAMLSEMTQKTNVVFESVRHNSHEAIEGAKAVEQINELTNTITAISTQTNLLALNASIEAARAGDAGKGFAVVASEIGALANQTSQTVETINAIVASVNAAVKNMASCLSTTSTFLESDVLTNYKEFMNVGEKYADDATSFQTSMTNIYDAVNVLSSTIDQISDCIEGIDVTINEASSGVLNIATKTSNMVAETNKNTQIVSETNKSVSALKEIVDSFTLH